MKCFAYTTCKKIFYIWLGLRERSFSDCIRGAGTVRKCRHCRAKCLLVSFSVSDKDDSCEEMSVPSSPQNEAIQHSSISTSNGVSSSSAAPAVSAPSGTAATSNQSTEESLPRRGATKSQPSGSWSPPRTRAPLPRRSAWQTEERDSLSASVWPVLFFIYSW